MPSSSTALLPLPRLLFPLVFVGLLLLSLFALGRSMMKSAAPDGGIDFHPYWYYSHFIHQGVNPYSAYATEALLPEPVQYIDGSVVAPEKVMQPRLADIPANTAPMLIFVALFAYLPWTLAKTVWMLGCVALVLAIPWLAMRLLPPAYRLPRGLMWLVALSFYALKGTRVAIANGQPSILVFALMLVTLLWRRQHWFWAGVVFGVALSKYSIALPVALFLLFEGRFRVLFVAAGVQALGLVVVAMLEGAGVLATVQVYMSMLFFYTGGTQGIHLGVILPEPWMEYTIVAVGTLITLAAVALAWRDGWDEMRGLVVNSLLMLWTLLAAYHRVYDTMLAILFLLLLVTVGTTWRVTPLRSQVLGVLWLVLVGILCFPGEVVPPGLSEAQTEIFVLWVERSVTVALVVMWLLNLWFVASKMRASVAESGAVAAAAQVS